MHRVEIHIGDITQLAVDAIVNAANEWMLGGGGVDGAIHRAAGDELLAACRRVPEVRPGVRCPTGEARLTDGFALPARWVVHTVGPIWRGGGAGEERLLGDCYRNSLEVAARHGARSIAFPAISCGAFGYPNAAAAAVAVREIGRFLQTDAGLESVLLVAFDARLGDILRGALERARRQAPGSGHY